MAIKQGDILQSIYGADFFEVVKATEKTVTVRHLADKGAHHAAYTPHSYETAHLPIAGEYASYPFWDRATNEGGKRCRVNDSCPAKPDLPCIKVHDHEWAVPWDGSAAIIDHYN